MDLVVLLMHTWSCALDELSDGDRSASQALSDVAAVREVHVIDSVPRHSPNYVRQL